MDILGDTVDFRGPSGLIKYKGHGIFETRTSKGAKPTKSFYRELGMVAGGSGITPMLQVCPAVFEVAVVRSLCFLDSSGFYTALLNLKE